MSPRAPGCRLDGEGAQAVLSLTGAWRLGAVAHLDRALSDTGILGGRALPHIVDGASLESIDTAAALLLLRRLAATGADPERLEFRAFSPSHQRIVDLVRARLSEVELPPVRRTRGSFARLGARVAALGSLLRGHVAFLGLVIVELGRVVARPSTLRTRELFAQFAQVCVGAIPVVALVTFLIGTIVAYLLGQQAEQYGANIFVIDGVALGMVREFSPLIVATIVAGRSGAAFTAQLGTMRLTEEIDAIRTLGLSPAQVLVIPRVLALSLSLPLLVFVGDLAGLSGAMLVSDVMLDLTPHTFVERVHAALAVRHYLIGLAKAPSFALFIAVIGCRMGMEASRDTRSVGINTTSTVVQSIVVVILLDAIFAVLLQELSL